MTRWPVVIALALTGAMLAVVSAQAQPDGGAPPSGQRRGMGGGPGMGDRAGGFGLVLMEQVQKELKITDEQKEKLQTLRREMRGNRENAEKKLAEILNPAQIERLKQIRIQVDGLTALNSPEVAKALALNEEQQGKLKTLRDEGRDKMREASEAVRDLTPEQRREKMGEMREKNQQLRKELTQKALEALTSEQREKFEKMKGAKIELDFSALRPQRATPTAPAN